MSKLSRSVLKGIIKECMVEIMQESFFPSSNSEMIDMLGESRSHSIDRQSYKKNMQEDNQTKKRSCYRYLSCNYWVSSIHTGY